MDTIARIEVPDDELLQEEVIKTLREKFDVKFNRSGHEHGIGTVDEYLVGWERGER